MHIIKVKFAGVSVCEYCQRVCVCLWMCAGAGVGRVVFVIAVGRVVFGSEVFGRWKSNSRPR